MCRFLQNRPIAGPKTFSTFICLWRKKDSGIAKVPFMSEVVKTKVFRIRPLHGSPSRQIFRFQPNG